MFSFKKRLDFKTISFKKNQDIEALFKAKITKRGNKKIRKDKIGNIMLKQVFIGQK